MERRLKTLDYSSPSELIDVVIRAMNRTSVDILKFLDLVQQAVTSTDHVMNLYSTDFDQKRMALQREEIVIVLFSYSNSVVYLQPIYHRNQITQRCSLSTIACADLPLWNLSTCK